MSADQASPHLEANNGRFQDGLPSELQHRTPSRSYHGVEKGFMSRVSMFVWKNTNFYRLHLSYFIVLDLIGTFIIWLSPASGEKISFIDALYAATSALTCTGLLPITMARFSVFNQLVLMLLILLGGQVFTSLLPVLIRRYYFHQTIERVQSEQRLKYERVVGGDTTSPGPQEEDGEGVRTRREMASRSHLDLALPLPDPEPRVRALSFSGDSPLAVAAQGKEGAVLAAAAISEANRRLVGRDGALQVPSVTWSGETARSQGERFRLALELFQQRRVQQEGRVSAPAGASAADPLVLGDGTVIEGEVQVAPPVQSVELRTEEYKALRTLAWLVPSYYLGVQVVAFLLVRSTFWLYSSQRGVLAQYDINATFFSAFQVASAFGNAGYSLLDTSMIEFQRSVLLLTLVGALILLGNTMYAPTMRSLVYLLYRFGSERFREEHGLLYLLEHPRKCFTHLFPFHQTLWLSATVLLFNAVELLFFCALDWNSQVLQGLSAGFKLLDGLFQSLNTRSSGFAVVPIGGLAPAMLFLYVGMMYVAVYPVFLSRQTSKPDKEVVLRRVGRQLSNSTYHEQQVGVFDSEDREFNDRSLATQARKLLGRDSALLFLSVFLIAVIHSPEVREDPSYSIFAVLFEVISAYGNVGLSLGYTCIPPEGGTCVSPPCSLSGVWNTGAKLVICAVMLMGRHRGLPENIDDAVRLPEKEEFREGVYVTEASLRFPDELVDPVEQVMLLRAERKEDSNFFKAISDRVGGSMRSPHNRVQLPRSVTSAV